jgi:uncharacterized protein YbjQ (UPF0145 family)
MEDYQRGSMEGVPDHARERLAASRGTNAKPGLFTSDLSVNEFLLLREAGFEPLGLVMGSSIYHVGWQRWALNQSMELETLTQAMYHARELAMTRMEEEADALGAEGVVGVHLEVTRNDWGQKLVEFMAIGTAVRARKPKDGALVPDYRAPSGRPFTSDLSGQEFWTLLRSGFRPVSLVMGTCVYHVGFQGAKQWFAQVGRNIEMPTFTQAVYDARELAVSRMQAEGEREQAEGIVGVRLEERSQGWGTHIIEYFSVGTAIVGNGTETPISTPTFTLALGDNGRRRGILRVGSGAGPAAGPDMPAPPTGGD